LLERFSKFVIEKHKYILVLWLALMIISTYPFKKVGEALTYSEEPFLPSYVESREAYRLLREKFPKLNLSDVILVIKGGDVRDQLVREFLKKLEEEVKREIEPVSSVDTLNKAYELVLSKYHEVIKERKEETIRDLLPKAKELHSNLMDLKATLSKLCRIIYGVPFTYYEMWRDLIEEGYSPPKYDVHYIDELAFLRAKPIVIGIYDEALGKLNTLAAFTLYNFLLMPYYYIFHYLWDDSLRGIYLSRNNLTKSGIKVLNEVVGRLLYPARALLSLSFEYPLGRSISTPGTVKLFSLILRKVNVTNWRYESTLNAIIEGYLRSELKDGQYRFAEAVLKLPSSPSEADYLRVVRDFVEEEFKRVTPPPYPNGIPPRLYRKYVNRSNDTMLVYFYFVKDCDEREGIEAVKRIGKVVRSLMDELGLRGYTAYLTGSYAFLADTRSLVFKDVSIIDKAAISLITAILGITLLSLIAPAVPLLSAGIALVISTALIYIVATYLLPIHYFAREFLTTVVLGAGVDYSVYLLYRVLEGRNRGLGIKKALEEALNYGSKALISSGLTVMVGFGSMAISDFGVLRSVGLCLALGVFMALLTSITFTPSLIALIGDRILWPRRLKYGVKGSRGVRSRYLREVASIAVRKPKRVLALAVIVTIILTPVLLSMKRCYNAIELLPSTEAKVGYRVLSESFGEYLLSNALIVIKLPRPLVEGSSVDPYVFNELRSVLLALNKSPAVRLTISPLSPEGRLLTLKELSEPRNLNKSLRLLDDKCSTALFIAYLDVPWSGSSSFKVIDELRNTLRLFNAKGLRSYVGGDIALTKDVMELVNKEFLYYMIPLITLGIYLVLLILLKSLIVPLKLLVTIGMSIVWSLGLLVAIVQWSFGIPIYWIVPIVVFNGIIGLGMDYSIFLISRVREEVEKGLRDEEAMMKAVEVTGTIITLCGTVMAASLATLMLSQVIILKETGFAFASAILLDTFVVRLLLLPSIMEVGKEWNWWFPFKRL